MTRTLIDAKEKPLRSSTHGDDELPALKPRRATSTSPLQDVMREAGSELKRQASNIEGERYPKLGDLTRASPDVLLKSIYSSPPPAPPNNAPATPTPKIVRKEISTPNLSGVNDMVDPFQDTPTRNVSSASNLSAGAAALEKSTSQDFTEVRQTRTSSLRARLSAGEVVKNRNSKVTGFTDFTMHDDPSGFQRRDSLLFRKTQAVRPQISVESLERAPAKFVAGSRRPRRSTSRGSLKEETRPNTASTRPGSLDASSVYSSDRPTSKGVKENRSSIPVLKITNQASATQAISSGTSSTRDSAVFDDATEMQAVRVAINSLGDKKATVTDVKKGQGLDSIDESPRHAYTFRRLSTKSPEFGPTLTISPSGR